MRPQMTRLQHSRPNPLRRQLSRAWVVPLLASVLAIAATPRTERFCERAVDGDTILLRGGERVRLIGVDTPELHHPVKPVQYFAREARDFVQSKVAGRRVWLEYDQQRRDRYGRTLAYVFLEDGTLLNLALIQQGYGFAYLKYPFREDYMRRFRSAEREARNGDRGLWAGRETRR